MKRLQNFINSPPCRSLVKICDHFFCKKVLNIEFVPLDLVINKIIPHVQVLSMIPTRLTAIIFHVDCALIVLIQDNAIGFVSLILQEVIIPQDVRHKIICGHEFGFCGAASVQFCLVDPVVGKTFLKEMHLDVCHLILGWTQ